MPVAEILVFLDLDEKSSFSFGRYLYLDVFAVFFVKLNRSY